MIYVVIDTNVFVSALWTKNNEAPTYRLAQLLLDGRLKPLYNEEILSEYKDVLNRDKFGFNKADVKEIISSIKEYGIESSRVPFDEPMLDEDDRVFYEVTLSKDDAYLVTGNQKHFPKTLMVVTPAEMLEILEQD
ncbi:MAG: putative toxin-antitoxin system toxin component, PIN family [Paludibacteraceae bacterium]|nr:putative toxin-antitoxin system toxin component, PIN family [Paludibacteraceae bacterium]